MALVVERAVREFKYNGMALQDPGAQMSAEEVKAFYANLYPELNNAAIEGPEQVGAKMVYEFRRAVGTKGVDDEGALRILDTDGDETACRKGIARLVLAMQEKLADKRQHDGRRGWHVEDECDVVDLADALIEQLETGDMVDIANFAMMLYNRSGGKKALARAWREHFHINRKHAKRRGSE